MKIAFLGNFRVPYTSENDYLWTLREMGHEVVPLQETEVTGDMVESVARQSDYFFWVHTHGWITPGKPMSEVLVNIRKAGVVSFAYHLDLWMGISREKDMKSDPFWGVDHFFTVDPQMADYLNSLESGPKGHYIKPGVVLRECYMVEAEKKKDIIFVGSYNYHPEHKYRQKLIDWLSTTYGDRFELWGPQGKGLVRGNELNKLYGSTKIVIGDSLCKDFCYPGYWSDRAYETLGRGGFLIHPFIVGMDEEFEDKKHLVYYTYDDFDGLKELIDYYLEHDKEREKIRKHGHESVKISKTYTDRMKQILEILENEPRPEVVEEPERDKWDVLVDRINRISVAHPIGDLIRRSDVIKIIRDMR